MVVVDALKAFQSIDGLFGDREIQLCNELISKFEAAFSLKRQQLVRNKKRKFIFRVIVRVLICLVVVISCAFNPFHTESLTELFPQDFFEPKFAVPQDDAAMLVLPTSSPSWWTRMSERQAFWLAELFAAVVGV